MRNAPCTEIPYRFSVLKFNDKLEERAKAVALVTEHLELRALKFAFIYSRSHWKRGEKPPVGLLFSPSVMYPG